MSVQVFALSTRVSPTFIAIVVIIVIIIIMIFITHTTATIQSKFAS